MKFAIALSILLTITSVPLTFPAFASSSAVDTTLALKRTDVVGMNNSAHSLDVVSHKRDEVKYTQPVQAVQELHATPLLAGHCSIWHQLGREDKS